jgi:hypothetical protein
MFHGTGRKENQGQIILLTKNANKAIAEGIYETPRIAEKYPGHRLSKMGGLRICVVLRFIRRVKKLILNLPCGRPMRDREADLPV